MEVKDNTPAAVEAFEPGEVVRLRSSELLMTVEGLEGDEAAPLVRCIWLTSHEHVGKARFVPACLERVERDGGHLVVVRYGDRLQWGFLRDSRPDVVPDGAG